MWIKHGKKICQRACYNRIWSWSPMPCEKHGRRASVTTKASAFGLGFVHWVPRAMFFTQHGRPWSNPTTCNGQNTHWRKAHRVFFKYNVTNVLLDNITFHGPWISEFLLFVLEVAVALPWCPCTRQVWLDLHPIPCFRVIFEAQLLHITDNELAMILHSIILLSLFYFIFTSNYQYLCVKNTVEKNTNYTFPGHWASWRDSELAWVGR